MSLHDDIDEYLKSGGTITVLPPFHPTPKPLLPVGNTRITTTQAAAILGVSNKTLREAVKVGVLQGKRFDIKPERISARKIYYNSTEIKQWARANNS